MVLPMKSMTEPTQVKFRYISFTRCIVLFMVLNATFNNISIIVAIILLVEETGVLGENNRPHLHRLELSQQVNIISRNTYHYDKKLYKQS